MEEALSLVSSDLTGIVEITLEDSESGSAAIKWDSSTANSSICTSCADSSSSVCCTSVSVSSSAAHNSALLKQNVCCPSLSLNFEQLQDTVSLSFSAALEPNEEPDRLPRWLM